jgi:inosine-uridine nucleoside N-ribohydrolase
MSIRIVHDCDPGNDDALASMTALGSPEVALQAVTTGAGHLASDRTARNAAAVMAIVGDRATPVTRGAAAPLIRERLIAGILDLETGLDRERADLAGVKIAPTTTSAEMIANLAFSVRGLTIVTTGPLTNLALALRNGTGVARGIERIVALGGAWGLGNETAAAEWNILCDPEAAAIVFSAGPPVTLVPIDATAQVAIDGSLVSAVESGGGSHARFAGELLRSLRLTHRPGLFGPAEAPLNDPLAILAAAAPSLTRTVRARVDVELYGRFTYGRPVVDFAGKSALAPDCDVVVEFDVPATRQAFVDALARLSKGPARANIQKSET